MMLSSTSLVGEGVMVSSYNRIRGEKNETDHTTTSNNLLSNYGTLGIVPPPSMLLLCYSLWSVKSDNKAARQAFKNTDDALPVPTTHQLKPTIHK
mmetsp:Transcript_3492/g.6741  ORF Transcript_3492/g.6741 Transcript_3492/m.6741 type:complete len:95 (+) Transcript_3492:55-339(+)